MPSTKTAVAALGVAALLLSTFFFAPLVGYTEPLALPLAYAPGSSRLCSEEAYGAAAPPNISFPPNATMMAEENAYQTCLDHHLSPPLNLTGRSSLAYEMLGIGSPPFPAQYYFSQGNMSGLVYFDGDRVASAYEFIYLTNVTVDPKGVFDLLNASVQFNGFGYLEFTASIRNEGGSPIGGLAVGTSAIPVPGQVGPANFSRDGVSWTLVPLAGAQCSDLLAPGQTCTATISLGVPPMPNATELHYFVYVEGRANGRPFFYRELVGQPSPQKGLNKDWMGLFIRQVDGLRSGPPLVENSTLDRFAAQRFETASSHPQISDYGFTGDANGFFGAASAGVEELLLYPGIQPPYGYAEELQTAPIHWSALMNGNFTQYGYYFGSAPYYRVSADCRTTEVPSQGINITQYFEGMGCQVTPVSDASWLVLVLSP